MQKSHFSPHSLLEKRKRVFLSENEEIAFYLLRFLLTGESDRGFDCVKLINPLIQKHDQKFQNSFFKELQEVLLEIFNAKDSLSHCTLVTLISHLLSFLAFVNIQEGSKLRLPVFQNSWKLISFEIEKVILTPKFLSSPVIAYGLVSKDYDYRLLLFRGTGYPTASGVLLSLLADFTPGVSVGSSLWHIFIKAKVSKWLQKSPQHVIAYGKSLGGSFALFAARDFPGYIAKVYVCNPAAGFFYALSEDEKINIYINSQDPVYYLGRYHPSWNVYASPTQEKLNPLLAHVVSYLCLENSNLVKVHPQTNLLRRIFTTLLHQTISLIIFPCLLIGLCFKEFLYFLGNFLKSFLK